MSEIFDTGPLVPLRVSDDTVIYVESLPGEQMVASGDWEKFIKPIEPVIRSIRDMLDKVQPDKSKVEFGVQLAMESGAVTSCIVKSNANANLKITLEWSNSNA